jgi:hypothetical protein
MLLSKANWVHYNNSRQQTLTAEHGELNTESYQLIAPALRYDSDWCAQESIFGADLIFQITQVSKVHEFRVVDIDHKCRWVGANLGAVVHF